MIICIVRLRKRNENEFPNGIFRRLLKKRRNKLRNIVATHYMRNITRVPFRKNNSDSFYLQNSATELYFSAKHIMRHYNRKEMLEMSYKMSYKWSHRARRRGNNSFLIRLVCLLQRTV